MAMRKSNKRIAGLVIIALVFSLVFPVDMPAKKSKRGSTLLIEKLDGQVLTGKLLKVEGTDLILMQETETGTRVSINEIKIINLKKKPKFLIGFCSGMAASIAVGAVWGSAMGDIVLDEMNGSKIGYVVFGAFLGALFGIPVGAIIGGMTGAATTGYKTYKVAGSDQGAIDWILYELGKKAMY